MGNNTAGMQIYLAKPPRTTKQVGKMEKIPKVRKHGDLSRERDNIWG